MQSDIFAFEFSAYSFDLSKKVEQTTEVMDKHVTMQAPRTKLPPTDTV